MNAQRKLSRLEAVRGFAATYVLLGHVVFACVERSRATLALQFGQEVVILFFLLSGFVIFYTTERNAGISFGEYLGRRFWRIYPIFGLALVASAMAGGFSFSSHWRELAGNLCMLQDYGGVKPGVWVNPFRGNLPLWSLSYEWWFYMLFFPVYRFIPEKQRVHVSGALSTAAAGTYIFWPNQMSLFVAYFCIWWSGAELASFYLGGQRVLRGVSWSLFYMGGLCTMWIAVAFYKTSVGARFSPGEYPMLQIRHTAAAIGAVILGLCWSRCGWRGFDGIFGKLTIVAPFSYALYVLHFPIVTQSRFLSFLPSRPLELMGYVIVAITLSIFAERGAILLTRKMRAQSKT